MPMHSMLLSRVSAAAGMDSFLDLAASPWDDATSQYLDVTVTVFGARLHRQKPSRQQHKHAPRAMPVFHRMWVVIG